jgi:hypothetical protein
MSDMMRPSVALLAVILTAPPAMGQVPQPFPRPGGQPQTQAPAAPAPAAPAAPVAQAPAAPAQPPAVAPADANAPDAMTVWFPVYPGAQYLTSYDAGRGQRYYIYGATAPYLDIVTFYRTQLRERGDQVFEQPLTHMFSIGRFREETMAFPPGVTVKDWTFGGSQGYPNPKGAGAQPARFPTIIMIVPPPPTAAAPAAR